MDNYILYALLISLLAGIQTVVHKHLLNKFNSTTVMFFTSIISSFFIILYSIKEKEKEKILSDIHIMTKNDILVLTAITLFSIVIVNIIYYNILKNHESSIIAALIYSSPIFTFIFSYYFLNEHVDMYGILGIFFIIIGIIFISLNNQFSKQLIFSSSK